MDVFPNVISRLILEFLNINEQNYVSKNWRLIVNVCEFSAIHGYLELLKWARSSAADPSWGSQGCDWDKSTCTNAAENGHLELLQWARSSAANPSGGSQGCPWDSRTCFLAAKNGHSDLLQWAKSQGCPEF